MGNNTSSSTDNIGGNYNYYLSDTDYISPTAGQSLDDSERESYDKMKDSKDEDRSDIIDDKYKGDYITRHNLDPQYDYLQFSKRDLDAYNDPNISLYSTNTSLSEDIPLDNATLIKFDFI